MKKKYWSGYAKYLVLADKTNARLHSTYLSYQDFVIVKNILEKLAKSDSSTYLYDGISHQRKVTVAEANVILGNIEECKWTSVNNKMLLVASQTGLRV